MSSVSQFALAVSNISKRFKILQALQGVSFNVQKNTVFSILGPNGAGKTTLIRILTTITRPDTGDAWIEGHSILTSNLQARQQLGVVAQSNNFDRYLSVWQNLCMHGQMHGMSRREYEARVSELLESVHLLDRKDALADELSGGMQRRVALIRALIHRPKVLFLDEPTTGLDPQSRMALWEMIRDFKRHATVILTTHYLEEADRLSDEILMLNQGQVVMTGTPLALKQALTPHNQYELALKIPKASLYLSLFNSKKASIPKLKDVRLLDPYRLLFTVSGSERLRLVPALDEENDEPEDERLAILSWVDPADFRSFGVAEANLEDVFMAVANGQPHALSAQSDESVK